MLNGHEKRGNALMEALAERYPELWIRPAEDTADAYRAAVCRGSVTERDLSHFIGNDEDELRTEQTPAGPVEVLYLRERADFETFLRCVGYRCKPAAIPLSVGAQTFFGLRKELEERVVFKVKDDDIPEELIVLEHNEPNFRRYRGGIRSFVDDNKVALEIYDAEGKRQS